MPNNDLSVFEFRRYEMTTGRCILVRVVDQNDIMLDTVGSEWSAVYRKMDYEKFFRDYIIIDEVEER